MAAERTVNLHVACGSCAVSSLTETDLGGGVELPAAEPSAEMQSAGWVFAGWSQAECQSSAVTPSLYAAAALYVPAADDETLYAVFSQTTGGGYVLVTEEPADWLGRYLIATAGLLFMDGSLAGGKDGVGASDAAVLPDEALTDNIVPDSWGDSHFMTITPVSADRSKGYLLSTSSAVTPYFYTTAAASAGSMSATDKKATATSHPFFISLNNRGEAILKVHDFVLRYNQEQRMFRFYGANEHEPVFLYRQTPVQTVFASSPCGDAVIENRNKVVFMVAGVQDSVILCDEQGHVEAYTPALSCTGKIFCGWTAEPVDIQQSEPEYIDFSTTCFDAAETEVYAVLASINGGKLTDIVAETVHEDFNSCKPATSYKEDFQVLETACGLKWQYVFGCPSETGTSVFFNNTVGFRLQQQPSAVEVYLELLTPVEDLDKVTFMAGRNASAVTASVSYMDGGKWSEEQPLSMVTTRSTLNTLQLPASQTTRIRIRLSSLGAKTNYLYLDDFVFYTRQRDWTLTDYSSSCQLAPSAKITFEQGGLVDKKPLLEYVSVSLPEKYVLPCPEMDGFLFDHWIINSTDFAAGDTYLLSHDVTATAVWKPAPFSRIDSQSDSSDSYEGARKILHNGTLLIQVHDMVYDVLGNQLFP